MSRYLPGPLVIVGDCLLDRDLDGRVERLSPDGPVPVVEGLAGRPRPGGAGLAAVLAAADGWDVRLVTALGADASGRELRELLDRAGVNIVDLGLDAPTPEKVRVRSQGRTLLRLDYGGPAAGPRGDGSGSDAVGAPGPEAIACLAGAAAVVVSDYGQGVTAGPALRAALGARPAGAPLVWDPHPRGSAPVAGASLVKPNGRHAGGDDAGAGVAGVVERARALRERWQADGVVVTLAERGAVLVTADPLPFVVPAPPVPQADTCGAGDRFCVAAAGLLARGASPVEAVTGAVAAASAYVASGGAGAAPGLAAPPDPAVDGMERTLLVAAEVRARGGRVVAAGGCFDLLHAGHVATLRAARSLGDCLVVCLNSDASVRRLKGTGRPLVPEADRAAVLQALGCVDAVVVFDEPTPEQVLRRLRPDVFVKGGDYAGRDLPERPVLAEWGGAVVLVPRLAGRSTSQLALSLRETAGG